MINLSKEKSVNDLYADDAEFMNAIRITKFSETGSKVLKDLNLTETVGNSCKIRKIYYNELPAVILENFGMPQIVVDEAISSIEEIKDIYD